MTTSSSLTFPANNTAGNLIVVAARSGKSSEVFSVSDSVGNTYRQAAQIDVSVDAPAGDTLAIFYAEGIKSGFNTVTVADSISGATLRFAILEYSGLASANSLEAGAAAQGTSASPERSPRWGFLTAPFRSRSSVSISVWRSASCSSFYACSSRRRLSAD